MRDRAEGAERKSRHHAERRFDSKDAADAGRNSDRTAAIGPDVQASQPQSSGNGGSAARSAWCHCKIPRITGDTGQRRVADALPAEFRRGGLADQDGARFSERRRSGSVDVPRLPPLGRQRSAQGWPAAGQDDVLDVAGTPSTGPERLTAKPARLRLPRGRKRTLPIDQTEGVVALVQQIDPLQNGFDRRAFSL